MEGMITIYAGGFIPDLAICNEGPFQGWLFAKHPDGQWVSLAKLPPPADSPRCTEEAGLEAAVVKAAVDFVWAARLLSEAGKQDAVESTLIALAAEEDGAWSGICMAVDALESAAEIDQREAVAEPPGPSPVVAEPLKIILGEGLPPGTIALIQDGKVTRVIKNICEPTGTEGRGT